MSLTFKPILFASTLILGALTLSACSGGGGSGDSGGQTPIQGGGGGQTPAPTSQTIITDEAMAARFLSYATFGGSSSDIQNLVGQDAADWLAAEFATQPTLYLDRVNALMPADGSADDMYSSNLFWDGMVSNPDQVRTRMVFALSQIFVIEDTEGGRRPRRAAYFMDALASNALGNYRDLLEDVTFSPIMSRYLTYYRNRKGDPNSGRMPDENYAREVMQLFSIGLDELNLDGSLRLVNGEPVDTYSNDDVVGLSRVFTGFSGKGEAFWRNDDDALYSRLVLFEDQHSTLEKAFLGTVIPADTPAAESVEIALDTLASHPNVAPFLSRQLIQRLTASNPSPAYIERVATAFESGQFTADNDRVFGTGQRGDLQATAAAILLDESLFSASPSNDQGAGKVREPILLFVHWARAFATNINASNERDLSDTRSASDRLSQHPFRSPSVFNFYRPGFVAPNSESGAAGLTAPELQILNEASTLGYLDIMSEFIFDRSSERENLDTYEPDYTDEIALADDPQALADHLDMLLTGGRMEAIVKTDIVETLSAYPIEADSEAIDRQRRVQMAVLIAVNAPSFRVIR